MKKLNLRNYIVRAITTVIVVLSISGFYGWFIAEIIYRLFY